MADASHELKTPITAIEGHARVVVRSIDRSDLPQARESAEIVLRESRRLAVMLGELLALAEAGAIPPAPRRRAPRPRGAGGLQRARGGGAGAAA